MGIEKHEEISLEQEKNYVLLNTEEKTITKEVFISLEQAKSAKDKKTITHMGISAIYLVCGAGAFTEGAILITSGIKNNNSHDIILGSQVAILGIGLLNHLNNEWKEVELAERQENFIHQKMQEKSGE